ncbi:hypothetical protein ScPMuIL_004164 [Solemya velum]
MLFVFPFSSNILASITITRDVLVKNFSLLTVAVCCGLQIDVATMQEAQLVCNSTDSYYDNSSSLCIPCSSICDLAEEKGTVDKCINICHSNICDLAKEKGTVDECINKCQTYYKAHEVDVTNSSAYHGANKDGPNTDNNKLAIISIIISSLTVTALVAVVLWKVINRRKSHPSTAEQYEMKDDSCSTTHFL